MVRNRNLGFQKVSRTNSPLVAKVYGQTARDMRRLGKRFTTFLESDI